MSAKPKDTGHVLEDKTFQYVSHQHTVIRMTSAQLSTVKVPLAIASHLHTSGMIDLSTKLKLELAFQEALTNSLEHGNLELQSIWKDTLGPDGNDTYSQLKSERLKDPAYADRWIHLEIDYNGENLCILIRDQGSGFNLDMVEKLTKEQDQSHGRGLALIHSAMDEVSFNENGKVIHMVKQVTQNKDSKRN